MLRFICETTLLLAFIINHNQKILLIWILSLFGLLPIVVATLSLSNPQHFLLDLVSPSLFVGFGMLALKPLATSYARGDTDWDITTDSENGVEALPKNFVQRLKNNDSRYGSLFFLLGEALLVETAQSLPQFPFALSLWGLGIWGWVYLKCYGLRRPLY